MDVMHNEQSPHPQATIGSDESGRVIVALRGEIDLGNVDELEQLIAARLQPADTVIFDLSGVEFMDTSGIALLLDIVNSVAAAEVRSPSRQVRRVLEATGLMTVLRVGP